MPRVLLLSHDLSNNAVGRAYVFWLLCQELGWPCAVRGPGTLWEPLRGTAFAEACAPWPPFPRQMWAQPQAASDADVLVAIKPWRTSFELGERLAARCDVPLIVDLDDPDLPSIHGSDASWRFRMVMRLKGYTRRRVADLEQRLARHHRTVSNPVLAERYGGTVIPHVRVDPGLSLAPTERDVLRIGFAGSPRPHKGLPVLREAVTRLADGGAQVELVVTAEPPTDVRPHETWRGPVPFAELPAVLANLDVIAVPSVDDLAGREQLPAKLVDAMLAARAIVASDLPPIRWALNDAGLLVSPGSVDALIQGLEAMMDPARRETLAELARTRGLERFTPEAVAPEFEKAVRAALA